ncbi:hypothetical protein B0H14DRAFT_2619645 [Mycena olivaceomarginata]|nr:hypothetical protein B0H14DRAFT_2619645 [Mycena olivaceomarginata]
MPRGVSTLCPPHTLLRGLAGADAITCQIPTQVRSFAATMLKAMLAHLVINYDLRGGSGRCVRPPDNVFGAVAMPNRKAKTLATIRARSERESAGLKCSIWLEIRRGDEFYVRASEKCCGANNEPNSRCRFDEIIFEAGKLDCGCTIKPESDVVFQLNFNMRHPMKPIEDVEASQDW